jgi:hypothetical protein
MMPLHSKQFVFRNFKHHNNRKIKFLNITISYEDQSVNAWIQEDCRSQLIFTDLKSPHCYHSAGCVKEGLYFYVALSFTSLSKRSISLLPML